MAKAKPDGDYLFACYDRLAHVLEKIVAYERPKLQAITLAGDGANPLEVRLTLPQPAGPGPLAL